MEPDTFKNIFAKNKLIKPKFIEEVAVGFSNLVYSVDDKYILKICNNNNNELPFERESILYKFYEKSLPVPRLITYDNTKTICEYNYMLYHKIDGINLYNIWHTLTVAQRKYIVKQLCNLLKTINDTAISSLPKDLKLPTFDSWAEHVLGDINKLIVELENNKTIDKDFADSIRRYAQNNNFALVEQKMALVYWDTHFDNILVKDGEIVGLIDFERTELASIDFALDIVKRMVEYPKKYMSLYAEQFAKTSDYADLLKWYKLYYPELFNFNHLDARLNYYKIEHNLKDLQNWPNATQLTDEISQIINHQ